MHVRRVLVVQNAQGCTQGRHRADKVMTQPGAQQCGKLFGGQFGGKFVEHGVIDTRFSLSLAPFRSQICKAPL
jgi:hypothetical protein